MEQEQIEFFLSGLSKSFLISTLYFQDDKLIASNQPFDFAGKENQFSYIIKRLLPKLKGKEDSHVYYDINKYLVFIGVVVKKLADHNEYILVGPVASVATTDENIQSYLFNAGVSVEGIKVVSRYMKENKRMTMEQFLHIMSTTNMIVNGLVERTDQFVNISKDNVDYQQMVEAKPVASKIDVGNQPSSKSHYDHELLTKRIHFCMQKGLVELLPNLLAQMADTPIETDENGFFTDELENFKVLAIGELYSAYNTALDAGVNDKAIDNLKFYYLHKINTSNKIEELHNITVDILFEFTKVVRDNRTYTTSNPTINRVIQYIQSNISSKLTVEMIAEVVHASPNYIFTRFKKEMNMTVLDFITNEKIRKAEYYLLFTERSLIDISEYLGFSSQSYFQTVFKKIKGITPNKFRETATK